MAVPDFQTSMLSFLQSTADGETYTARELRETLAEHFNLTPEELKEMLTSGTQKTFFNRVGWAKTYLAAAGLYGDGQLCARDSATRRLKESINPMD